MAAKTSKAEPWVVIGVIEPEVEAEVEAIIFIGPLDKARMRFEEEIIKETYPNIYLCKVVESAELSWDMEKFSEPPSLSEAANDVLAATAT